MSGMAGRRLARLEGLMAERAGPPRTLAAMAERAAIAAGLPVGAVVAEAEAIWGALAAAGATTDEEVAEVLAARSGDDPAEVLVELRAEVERFRAGVGAWAGERGSGGWSSGWGATATRPS